MIREGEIEALKEILAENKDSEIRIARSFLEDIVDYFGKQSKIGEWIPCSEKLPEPGERYLVSAIWQGEDSEIRRVYDAVYGIDGVWHGRDYKPGAYKVIAWQPLPKPYRL